MAFLGARAPPTVEVPASTTALPPPMASLGGALSIWWAALSCVACSPTTASSVEAPESTSMEEGPGASLAWELVGAEEGLTTGVAGAMTGEESRCSISLIFLEAPRVLEDFLRLVVAFFLKRAKCISTGIRQINETMSENKKLTLGGRFGKHPGGFLLFRLQGDCTLFGGSTLRLLLLTSVGSVRGGALPLSRQRDIIVGHDRDFLHLWIIDLGSQVALV